MPDPIRRERWAPTRPSGCGASARESYGARTGSTCSWLPDQGDRAPAVARPAAGEGDVLMTQDPPSPPPRADLQHREPGAVGDEPAEPAVGRVGGDERSRRRHPGHVLDPVEVGDQQPRARALSLVHPLVVEHGRSRRDSRPAGAAARGRPAAGRARRAPPAPRRRTRPRAPGRAPRPPGTGSGPRSGATASWPPRHGRRAASRVAGVGTRPSTSSTTREPVTSVIQSSGRTVIRCARTERATALTSSGMT